MKGVDLKHIKKELDEKVVCVNFAHTIQHGAIKEKSQHCQMQLIEVVRRREPPQGVIVLMFWGHWMPSPYRCIP